MYLPGLCHRATKNACANKLKLIHHFCILHLKYKSMADKKLEKWIIARKKHKLTDKRVQMARELGLSPDKLGKIDNHKQEPW